MRPRSSGPLNRLLASSGEKQSWASPLDADLLRWFRREPGYQTRINAILRAYMQAHES